MSKAMRQLIVHRMAAIKIQALARKAIQRPIFLEELAESRENQKLENQLVILQEKLRKLEEADRKRIEEEKKPKEERTSAPAPSTNSEQASGQPPKASPEQAPATLSVQQQALMDESGKMLEYLRKEVFKLRSQNSQLRQDVDSLKESNHKLMDANASAGASFAALNNHVKHLTKANQKLQTDLIAQKQIVSDASLEQVELKEELKMKQATYIAEVHSRLLYQKTLNEIVDMIHSRCKDDDLIDDVLILSDDCEADYMNGPTGMNAGPPTPSKSRSGVTDIFKSIASPTKPSSSPGITEKFMSYFGSGTKETKPPMPSPAKHTNNAGVFAGLQTFSGTFTEAE